MLLTFERLRAKPPIFKAFTGVASAGWSSPLNTEHAALGAEPQQQRLTRANRQRALGGGCKHQVWATEPAVGDPSLAAALLTTETLGFLFGIDKATVSRYTRAIFVQYCAGQRRHVELVRGPKHGQGKDLASGASATPICLPSWTPRSTPVATAPGR